MKDLSIYEAILGLPNFQLSAVETLPRKYIFHGEYTIKESTCPCCLSRTTKVNQRQVRKFRDLKISEREVWLHVQVPQFVCIKCSRYHLVNPTWVMKGKSYTKRQSKWIFELCQAQSISQAAVLADMAYKTVERLFYNYGEKQLNLKERYANVRHLGIDEVACRKGKKNYICVLSDLERGIQLDVLPDRKKTSLVAHFQSLGAEFCAQIQVVACDVWKAYINTASSCFSNCEVVIDRFHLVKALNSVLDAQRKQLRKAHADKACFKTLKWVLYKRADKCSQSDKAALETAFKESWLLEELYQLRLSFNAMFDRAASQQQLSKDLHAWVKHAQKLAYKPLDKFLTTINNWKKPITAFATHRVSNAVTEGLNNHVRFFNRIAFGLPKFEHLRMRLLAVNL